MPAAVAVDQASAIEFDFASKAERNIALDDAPAACDAGRFCWLDFDLDVDRAAAEQMLRRLKLSEPAIAAAFDDDVDGRYDLYDECLHLSASAVVPACAGGDFMTQPVSIILGERFLITCAAAGQSSSTRHGAIVTKILSASRARRAFSSTPGRPKPGFRLKFVPVFHAVFCKESPPNE